MNPCSVSLCFISLALHEPSGRTNGRWITHKAASICHQSRRATGTSPCAPLVQLTRQGHSKPPLSTEATRPTDATRPTAQEARPHSGRLCRQPLPALGPATRENAQPTHRRHPLTEAMAAFANEPARLISPLHVSISVRMSSRPVAKLQRSAFLISWPGSKHCLRQVKSQAKFRAAAPAKSFTRPATTGPAAG